MAIDLIVLGLDNVLFDTEDAQLHSCNHAFEQCGISHRWSVDQYRNAAFAHGATKAIVSVMERLAGTIAKSDAALLSQEKNRSFHDLARAGRIALNSGCVHLIDEAVEDGCKLAIVTDMPASTAALLLEQAFKERLTDMFAAIASAVNFDPANDNSAYHLVVRTIGADPSRSVAIDASAPALLAARRAGLWTLATTPAIDGVDSITGSDSWCPDLRLSSSPSGNADGQARLVSLDMLEALKSASGMHPSFANPATAAWT
jgi:beta-phosphoglucomutase-like phosphatase (HAD superfamily)